MVSIIGYLGGSKLANPALASEPGDEPAYLLVAFHALFAILFDSDELAQGLGKRWLKGLFQLGASLV